MSLLGLKQLIGYAIRLEENGEQFYRAWAEKQEDPKHREFFSHLAEEEIRHRVTFNQLANMVSDKGADPANYDDYAAYLSSFSETLFNSERQAAEMAAVQDIQGAVEFAMRRELDSILFYQEIKPFVNPEQEGTINTIINEERNHYRDLAAFRQTL